MLRRNALGLSSRLVWQSPTGLVNRKVPQHSSFESAWREGQWARLQLEFLPQWLGTLRRITLSSCTSWYVSRQFLGVL
jgi:hypothetical protein